MPGTCFQEKKAHSPALGNTFLIAHFQSFSLYSGFIALFQLQPDKDFSFQHKMIFQTPLNIFVRQGQPTKLNCWYKGWLLFKAGERLQGIITLSKNISGKKSNAHFSSSFGCVLIHLPSCIDLVFHCHFIEKSDKCQSPKLQDIQAYSLIAAESQNQDRQRDLCALFL